MKGMVLLLLFFLSHHSDGSHILGLFPYKGASHFYVFQPLLEELARRGHTVDVVSHFPRKESLENYYDVSLAYENEPGVEFATFDEFENIKNYFLTNLQGLLKGYLADRNEHNSYERALSLPQVLALTNASYDLVITEMFNSDVFFGLVHKIGAPVIGFSSCQVLPWVADAMTAPNDLGFVPSLLGGHGPDMDFFERLINTIELWAARLYYRFFFRPDAQAIAERILGPLPDLNDIATNTSVLLVNSHFSLLGQRPLPQSIIEVGGINVREVKPLPEVLERITNNTDGVIYFSMGSVLKGSTLPQEKSLMFLNAFKSSGKTVFWKREEPLSTTYPNIVTRDWFPQRDVLGHPKTELFISHCGLLGLNEAVVSGVPVLCIPMFGDQPMNARFVSHSGIGIALEYHTLTEAKLVSAINEILLTTKYKKRAAEVSAAYRDRPMSPLDTAVFWVEYVLRHGPQPFMAPFKKMPLWIKLGYDVGLAIAVAIMLIVSVFVGVVRLTYSGKVKPMKLKQC